MNMNIEYLAAQSQGNSSFSESARRKISLSSSAATMRVLSVMRHWITKHSQVRRSQELATDKHIFLFL